MPDRRSVDDLSIDELEQILRMKKREARLARLRRYERDGRRSAERPSPEDLATPPQPDTEEAQIAVSYQAQPEPAPASEAQPERRSARSLRDNLLLGIEIAAALTLVAILAFAAKTVADINREASAVQAAEIADLPTPTATPIVTAVVLPSGHTPPTAPGGAQPNYDEVPASLRPFVEEQFAGPVIQPTPAPSNAIRLQVPRLDIDKPIVQGDGWEQLKKGVGQHLGTADPGQPGNLVLSAHNDVFGEIFRYLDRLSPGDQIIVHSADGLQHVYRVIDYGRQVDPTDVEVMAPTREPVVTLISCYPYLVNSHRIVVVGELIK